MSKNAVAISVHFFLFFFLNLVFLLEAELFPEEGIKSCC